MEITAQRSAEALDRARNSGVMVDSIMTHLNVSPDDLSADVLISGGGLVGLSAGIALAQSGLSVIAADRDTPPAQIAPGFDGRCSALSSSSWRMMRCLGLWEYLSAGAEPIREIRVSDGDSRLFLHFDDPGNDEPLGVMLENRCIREALFQRVSELPDLTLISGAVIYSCERGPHDVRAVLSTGQTVRARLLIGAEGRISPSRDAAGIRVTTLPYRQTGIVATLSHTLPHRGIAHERFLPPGPFAVLPLTNDRVSIVWTVSDDLAPAAMSLGDDAFNKELRKRIGDFLGDTRVEGPRWSYPLSLQLAERFFSNRLALAGDAAHAMHPIAGQGLNLGLRDVAALAEVIVSSARRGEDIGSSLVLERYAAWRRADTLTLLGVTDGLTRLFSNAITPLRIARSLGLGAVQRMPPLRRFFMRHARGEAGNLPKMLRGDAL